MAQIREIFMSRNFPVLQYFIFRLGEQSEISSTLAENATHTNIHMDYMKQVANLIPTEDELFGIGIALKLTINDIKKIRADNIRDLPTAAFKVLNKWFGEARITDVTVMKEQIHSAFEEAEIAWLLTRLDGEETSHTTSKSHGHTDS